MSCWTCGFEITELTTPTCNNGCCQTCRAVAKVDEEINQAVAALRLLLIKRCDLRSEQNSVHGTLIHRLPAELKNYIFELLLPSQDRWGSIEETERPSTTTMPSFLASICRSWRDTAWSNPWLWSTIRIKIGVFSIFGPSNQLDFARDWILRSGTLPLTLHVVIPNKKGLEEELKDLCDSIGGCSNRLHSLSLEIPGKFLHIFQHINFRCHLFNRLRINATGKDIGSRWHGDTNDPVSLLNRTANPKTIVIRGVLFQSLQISCNNLTFAKVKYLSLEGISQLFQQASQMTSCYLLSPRGATTIPPIVHHRLSRLGLFYDDGLNANPLDFLTLPHLQEFHTNYMHLLQTRHLPALVHRSSCPLTTLRLFDKPRNELGHPQFESLPGVTDLLLETLNDSDTLQADMIKNFILRRYFRDLCRFTLRLQPFLFLWRRGTIGRLLDHNRDGGECYKILVVDEACKINEMWDSDVGEQLKALETGIRLREDGFEFF